MIAPELIEAMAQAGITAQQIAATVKHYAALTAESRAEKREQNRIRQQNHRERNASSRVTERDTPALDKEIPPTPPKEIKPTPLPPVVVRARDFDTFWALFPNKVGKRTADREFGLALQRSSFDEIMAGLRRYVDKTDDRPWCNPSTFLHQNRWDDQPASVTRRQNGHSPPNGKRMNAVEALQSLYSEPSHEPSRAPSPYDDAERVPTGRTGLPATVVDFRRGSNGYFKPGDS